MKYEDAVAKIGLYERLASVRPLQKEEQYALDEARVWAKSKEPDHQSQQAFRAFTASISETALGRAFHRSAEWLAQPKPLNRATLALLILACALYVVGSIIMTIIEHTSR